ncbi:SDR family oxidoreductase [Nocardia amamiensis]|uniref:SDR family oxidoreductase n=1 Tax=Nocardia amamiensis TaxID=404578 RepID=UPI0033D775D6
MARFTGRSAIVTGAARGIGAAYAQALAAEGASVVVADKDADGGAAVVEKIVADGGTAVFGLLDVSDPESATALADFAAAEFGGIDHLVNNAAIYGEMKLNLLLTVPWDYYKTFMSVNMDGALNMTRAVWPHMSERGAGSIVNQSSTAAWLYSSFYGLAKVGVNGLTQQLAFELGGSGIRINAIAPGPIDTDATKSVTPDVIVDDIVKRLPLKRIGTPQDLVGACLFLLSDEASWVTGQIFNVDGGQIVRS